MPVQGRRNQFRVQHCIERHWAAVSNQPRRAVGLARTLQSSGTRVRKYEMAVQEGVSVERNSFADFEIALH